MTGPFGYRRATPLVAALACAICCVLLGSPRRAEACPAEPLFSEYVNMADLIFVGKVVSVAEREMATPDGETYQTTFAVVKPETVLKGTLDTEKTVEISGFYYGPDGASGDALAAMSFLIFASPDGEAGNYGAQTARDVTDAAVADAYTTRVRELLDILKIADGAEREPQMLEWAVRCAEERATRGEGVRELFSLCGYPDDGEEEARPEIDSSQRERLVAALQSTETSGWGGAFELAGFLARYRDARVTDCLVGWLRQVADDPTEDTRYLLYIVADHLDWQTGRYLAERYPSEGEIEARRTSVARFLELMQTREELPEAIRAAEPQQSDAELVEVYERENTIREAEEQYEFTPEDEEAPAEELVTTESPDEDDE
jgi:hypothetical protein